MVSGPHFTVAELACKHCGMRAAQQELVDALERTRAALGGAPIALRSAYRCPIHNKNVGGATKSQHMFGLAVDLVRGIPVDRVRALGLWSGIGRSGALAVHLDVRHARRATNFTNGTPGAPTVWSY